MPRRSRSYGERRSRSRPAVSRSSMPKPAARPPQPAPVGGNRSAMGGFGAAVVDGMALGTGSALAHRAVDVVMGPRVVQHETVASSVSDATQAQRTSHGDACRGQSKALQDCLNNYGSDISKCQFYMDMWQECCRSSMPEPGA